MKKTYPLSYAQKVIWEVENFIPNTSINTITGTLRFKEEFELSLLEKAVNLLLKKTMRFEFDLEFKMENRFNMLPTINTID